MRGNWWNMTASCLVHMPIFSSKKDKQPRHMAWWGKYGQIDAEGQRQAQKVLLSLLDEWKTRIAVFVAESTWTSVDITKMTNCLCYCTMSRRHNSLLMMHFQKEKCMMSYLLRSELSLFSKGVFCVVGRSLWNSHWCDEKCLLWRHFSEPGGGCWVFMFGVYGTLS